MMTCLTISQPYAYFVVNGMKTIENREWPTEYRGPLLIHAGKKTDRFQNISPELAAVIPSMLPAYYPMGAFVGIVKQVDCVPLRQVEGHPFAEGPWCHIYEEAHPFPEPIPYRGRQKLWRVSEDVVADMLERTG